MSGKFPLFRWLFVALVVVFGGYLVSSLRVNDNALNMLPETAVRADLQKLQEIGLVDRVVITLSADLRQFENKQAAQNALTTSAEALGKELESSESFSEVLARLPSGYEQGMFQGFAPYLPLLLDDDDLSVLQQRISPEGLQKQFRELFATLNSPQGLGLKQFLQYDPLGIMGLFLEKLEHLRGESTMQIKNGFFLSADGLHCLVQADSSASLVDSNIAFKVEKELETIYSKALSPGISPLVIGSLPHTVANAKTVQKDLRLLLPIASVLLILLLLTAIRSIRAAFIFSIPFLAAPLAIGITNWWFGEVSRLALGFGVVLLGIAVDFSVHLYLSLEREEGTADEIMARISKPICFATLTTVSVFSVLLLSQVTSHRQMAVLAFCGVLLAVLLSLAVIPLIVVRKTGDIGFTQTVFRSLNPGPAGRRIIFSLWMLVILLGGWSWQYLEYNGDLKTLDVANKEVAADEQRFAEIWGEKSNQAFILAEGETLEEALDKNSIVYTYLQSRGFDHYQSLAPMVPGPETQQAHLKKWKDFWSKAQENGFKANFTKAASDQGFNVQAFTPFFSNLDKEPVLMPADVLSESTLAPVFFSMMREVKESGNTPDHYLILTTVLLNDHHSDQLLQLDEEGGITVIANDKWRQEVGHFIKKDMMVLGLLAWALIMLIVIVQFRRIDAVAAVLAPVITASSAMSIFCWLSGSSLNMMHVIMGIMVIGLSVDYGIFIVCANIERHSEVSRFAVSVCALSSLIGFGVLSFASHPALYSLGITVLIGIGSAWPAAIFVSPLFLKERRV